jgi:ABC-type sugar transport system permease subunit
MYIVISLINVFLHIVRSILVIKSGKMMASLANCICYTFSAVVVKFIAETDLMIAILVQATTNFIGCYLAMLFCDYMLKNGYKEIKIEKI